MLSDTFFLYVPEDTSAAKPPSFLRQVQCADTAFGRKRFYTRWIKYKRDGKSCDMARGTGISGLFGRG